MGFRNQKAGPTEKHARLPFKTPFTPARHGPSVLVMSYELDGILGHLPGWFSDRHSNFAGYNEGVTREVFDCAKTTEDDNTGEVLAYVKTTRRHSRRAANSPLAPRARAPARIAREARVVSQPTCGHYAR